MSRALLCACLLFGFGAAAALAAPSSTSEKALLDSVKQDPLAKLGPWLINLHQEYRQYASNGHKNKLADFQSSNPLLHMHAGYVAIEGAANDPDALRQTLQSISATNVRGGVLFSAMVPVDQLDRLGRDRSLRSARPVLAQTRALPVPAQSQGVISLFGQGGNTTGFDGSGVRIGVLSDSYNCEPGPFLPGAPTSTVAQDQANGELPADVVVADNGACPSTDEGRAIMQIIHDVAPGASLAFHTAFNGRFDFACGILELAGIDTPGAAAACGAFGIPYSPLAGSSASDVVVDDVIYFAEPMFMPGAVAEAANTVVAAGVPYFSSAGNNARASYEAPYDEVVDNGNFGHNLNRGAAPGPNAIRVHQFAPGDTTQTIHMTQTGGPAILLLSFQWDQPHFSSGAFNTLLAGGTIGQALAAPGATTDMDIVFYDSNGILVPLCPPGVATGITCQITGDPNLVTGDAVDLSALVFAGPKAQGDFQVRIVRSGGDADLTRVKYVRFDLAGVSTPTEYDTQSGSGYGHANTPTVGSVGAAAWYATVEWKDNPADDPFDLFLNSDSTPRCDPACANDFSSAGGIGLYFDAVGNRLGSPVVPNNPWVVGPDGGNTSFFFADSSFDDDDGDGLNSPFSGFLTAPDPDPASEYPNFFGTSASAPHVAAVAGLMLQKNPALTPAQILGVLRDTAQDMSLRYTNVATPTGPATVVFPIADPDPAGFDFDTGYGFVDAAAALNAVSGP